MNKELDLSTKQLPERLVLEFFNRVWYPPHDLEAIDELMTEDYTITTAGVVVKGRDYLKIGLEVFRNYCLKQKTKV